MAGARVTAALGCWVVSGRPPGESCPARGLVVAIDGPSGSGKSSVSRAVARSLGLGLLDTGAMYRALTWWCLDQGIALDDTEVVAQEARRLPLQIGTDPESQVVRVGGRDVSRAIREPRISELVSKVATNLGVRAALRERQRALITDALERTGGVVAEGRDITTVVAPDADVRILLTANEEARVARRSLELHGHAEPKGIDATRDQVLRRDRDDSTVSQFRTAADGVTTLDTSAMSLQESVQAVLALVREVTKRDR